jgi:hypothetical protein
MGAGSNAASKSDLTSLKNTVASLQTKVKSLETTSIDDKAIKDLVKNIDYQKLRNELRMDELSTEVLKNPGAIADSVAQSFTKDAGKIAPIATALADNQTFAKTLAETLTDASGKYRLALQGLKGETGNLASSSSTVKTALYDTKYTLWCADGGVCKMPQDVNILETPNIKVQKIQIGDWFLQQHSDSGNLHFHRGDVNDWYLSVDKNKTFHVRDPQINGKNIVKLADDFYWTLDNNMVRVDKMYQIKSGKKGCLDSGSGDRDCNWGNAYKRFQFENTPYAANSWG